MQYDFKLIKEEFLKITADEWNDFVKKYPHVKMSELDDDMKKHFNNMLKSTVNEPRDANIHYDCFKIKK